MLIFTLSLLSLSKSVSLFLTHTLTYSTHIFAATHCQEYCVCLSVRWKVWILPEFLQDTTVKHTHTVSIISVLCVWVCVRPSHRSQWCRNSFSVCVCFFLTESHITEQLKQMQTHTHKQVMLGWQLTLKCLGENSRRNQIHTHTHREEIVIFLIAMSTNMKLSVTTSLIDIYTYE